MNRRCFLSTAFALPPVMAEERSITAFGAVADGKQNSRVAIQRAIDACFAQGGGIVRIPAGRFVSGTLRLKSGVALWLDHGAVLTASNDPAQYETRHPSDRLPRDSWECAFLLAERAERVAILGHGTITGAGFAKPTVKGKALEPFRPRLISFEHCRDVRVEGITMRDSDRWTLHCYDCDSVQARGLRILARYDVGNTDGIDVDGSRNVVISGCEIVVGDDCIVIKTTNYLGDPCPCENVTVSNCVLSTRSAGLKIGTETHGDFSNITFTNCTVFGNGQFRPDGVCLEAVDGARLRGVSVSNISMQHVRAPIFVRAGARAAASRLEDAVISNIVAVDADMASSITGIPAQAVENVSVSNARIVMAGAGDAALSERVVPEKEKGYPSGRMFGELPAYGFYVRHAHAVDLSNIRISCERADERPVLVADDVVDLTVDGLRAEGQLRLKNVRKASMRGGRGCVVVSGSQSDGIAVAPDCAANTGDVLKRSPEVTSRSVRVLAECDTK